jgi:hypothetical protein
MSGLSFGFGLVYIDTPRASPRQVSPRYLSSSEATLSPTHTDDMSVPERHPSPWRPFLALGYKTISMSV